MPARAVLLAALLAVLPPPRQAPEAWPQFRGPHAAGAARGQNLPDAWDGTTGAGVRWKTRVPGLAHSSPIVWGDRVFVTSAVSSRADATFKPGLYGEGTASEDMSVHRWVVMALDRATGRVVWERTAWEGVPRQKRHIKSTYASATPVTDGRVVVASFGSMGLYAWDLDGRPLWRRDLGHINAGAYDVPSYEWGTASSPILHDGFAILQCDQQQGAFLLAVDARTGQDAWRTPRDELPSWGTPTVVVPARSGASPELVTNGSNFIRGYDPRTGRELWRLGGSSKITAPTPVFTDEFIVVASGRRDEKPIFVIRPGARGDISLAPGEVTNAAVVWHKRGRGPYMPTPLVDAGLLYVLGNDGILDAYELSTGREVYRQRIPHSGSGFSASPVIADGRILLSSEDGDMFVVRAGETFELLGRHAMGEPLMATPAIAGGALFVRGQHHLFAIGR